MIWALKQQEYVVEPLADLVAETIPSIQEVTNEAIIYAASEYLKSDEAK